MDVALQRTVYTATEGDSKICAVVNTSIIGFDFNINITFKTDSDDKNLFPGLCSTILKAHNFILIVQIYISSQRACHFLLLRICHVLHCSSGMTLLLRE